VNPTPARGALLQEAADNFKLAHSPNRPSLFSESNFGKPSFTHRQTDAASKTAI
jgi:hypothetical protein